MSRSKGQPLETYSIENLVDLRERTPEERKRISQMGVEARRKKKEERMAMQNCMKQLLNTKVNKAEKRKILENFGFTDEEATNRALLMVALFQKGMTGDVTAIKEIITMMDKLELFEDTGKVATGSVIINLLPTGDVYQPNEKDEQDIWDAENDTKWMEEDSDDDEWGTDTYDG